MRPRIGIIIKINGLIFTIQHEVVYWKIFIFLFFTIEKY